MVTITTNEFPEQQQHKDSMVFVAFERDENATQYWYSGIYRRAVRWLQKKPMVYSHVFLLLYTAYDNTWYTAEAQYVMGDKSNGVIVGMLTDEVVVIPRDEYREYTVCLMAGDEMLRYDAVRLPCYGDRHLIETMLRADEATLTKQTTVLDFIRAFVYGDCESYLCTDFVTAALDLPIDFIPTPDTLHSLLNELY